MTSKNIDSDKTFFELVVGLAKALKDGESGASSKNVVDVAQLFKQIGCQQSAEDQGDPEKEGLPTTSSESSEEAKLLILRQELELAIIEKHRLQQELTDAKTKVDELQAVIQERDNRLNTAQNEVAAKEQIIADMRQSNQQQSNQQQINALTLERDQLKAQLKEKSKLKISDFLDCGNQKTAIKALLDSGHDYDYRPQNTRSDREKMINSVRFLPPYGCVKFAIKAAGKYENDEWLKNSRNSWPTAFHGTSVENVRTILTSDEYKIGTSDSLRHLDGKVGFWASSDPVEALSYAKPYRINSTHFKALLQVRIRPGTYKENAVNNGKTVNYRVLEPKDNVRTMAICIFRVGDIGPDDNAVR